MVLKTHRYQNILTILFIAAGLNACSNLGSSSQNNRSPNNPVIPVKNQTVLFPSKPSIQDLPMEDTIKPSTNQSQSKPSILEKNDITNDSPSGKRLKPTDVLGSIIESAKKAIEAQQWLRAQHHLEHALRVAPKDAEVFYLYALVYEGLGVTEQMANMLKRARFLAKPRSQIYLLAEAKLAEIAS